MQGVDVLDTLADTFLQRLPQQQQEQQAAMAAAAAALAAAAAFSDGALFASHKAR